VTIVIQNSHISGGVGVRTPITTSDLAILTFLPVELELMDLSRIF